MKSTITKTSKDMKRIIITMLVALIALVNIEARQMLAQPRR